MADKNPKDKFLNLLSNIVFNFEEETGVEIKNIHFDRAKRQGIGQISSSSLIYKIRMEIR